MQTTLGKISSGPDRNGNVMPHIAPWMETGLKIVSDPQIVRRFRDGSYEPLMEIVLINGEGRVHPKMFEKLRELDLNSSDGQSIKIRHLTDAQFLDYSMSYGIEIE